ncbi:hypothetical protein NW752_008572 [Fusarium irregulare]|uniref:Uncharacterized protein n=1 Tax=Fusarium irregulare TaxID=2494466 RepID=A0A9W8PYZ4_9HYPO|nr:hypothetical protein NW752_008572 [Fusarium irregulare]KAJ4020504.1 hypothetical protein NW766_001991 [Fusarium irregulare]
MATKFLSSDEQNGRYYATIMIQWMPVCTTLTNVKAILESTTSPMPIASQTLRLGIDLGNEPQPSLCAGLPNMSPSPDYWPTVRGAIVFNRPFTRLTRQNKFIAPSAWKTTEWPPIRLALRRRHCRYRSPSTLNVLYYPGRFSRKLLYYPTIMPYRTTGVMLSPSPRTLSLLI